MKILPLEKQALMEDWFLTAAARISAAKNLLMSMVLTVWRI
jgi:hypothetical protein